MELLTFNEVKQLPFTTNHGKLTDLECYQQRIRTEYCQESGRAKAYYYPLFEGSKIVGYLRCDLCTLDEYLRFLIIGDPCGSLREPKIKAFFDSSYEHKDLFEIYLKTQHILSGDNFRLLFAETNHNASFYKCESDRLRGKNGKLKSELVRLKSLL
ncbi:hypothetical protein ACOJBV_003429 [Vibrio cholerae]|nr:hypothetical protein [Vibrio cholerae]